MDAGKLEKEEIDAIKKQVETEFPDDPALQAVHAARKILAREAEKEGISYLQYVTKTFSLRTKS